ncbi:MAG: hypothetical protein K0S65_6707 [Labilithrix sp.]|nr:hypothetical protein [Labilithrix sp.]
MTAKLMNAHARKMSESMPRTRRESVRTRESLSTTSTNPIAVRHTPTMVVDVAKRVLWCMNARSSNSGVSGGARDDEAMLA